MNTLKTETRWYTKTKPDDLQGLISDEETGRNVAVSYDPKDAPLIAAAPELLDVLRHLDAKFGHKFNTEDDDICVRRNRPRRREERVRSSILLVLWLALCFASVAAIRHFHDPQPRVEIYTAHGVITQGVRR